MGFKRFVQLHLAAFMVVCSIFSFGAILSHAQTKKEGTLPGPVKKCWEYETNGLTGGQIASDNESLFFSQSGARIDAISAASGSKIWSTELGGETVSNIAVAGSNIYVITGANGGAAVLRSLSKDTGVTNWSIPFPYSGKIFLGSTDASVVAVSEAGDISAFDKGTGRALWTKSFSTTLSTEPLVTAGIIVFGAKNKKIFIISSSDGKLILNTTTEFIPTAVALSADGDLVWGDERGEIVSFDIADRSKNWKLKGGARISHISPVGERLLVGSLDNFVYMLSADSGGVVWKKRQPGRVTNTPGINGSFAVVIANGERTSQFIDYKKGKLFNQLTLGEGEDFVGSPVLFKESVVFPTSGGLEMYSLSACPAK